MGLSAIDGVLTLQGLSFGAIEELNPIMHWLIIQNAVVMGVHVWWIINSALLAPTYALHQYGLKLVIVTLL